MQGPATTSPGGQGKDRSSRFARGHASHTRVRTCYVTAYYDVVANWLLPPTSFVLLHRLPCLPAADSPGPGAYHPPPVGIKPSSPAYTLSPRLRPTSTASVHTEFNGSPGRQSRGQSAGLGRHEFGRPKTARGA